jgi:hypothetical protein
MRLRRQLDLSTVPTRELKRELRHRELQVVGANMVDGTAPLEQITALNNQLLADLREAHAENRELHAKRRVAEGGTGLLVEEIARLDAEIARLGGAS